MSYYSDTDMPDLSVPANDNPPPFSDDWYGFHVWDWEKNCKQEMMEWNNG